MNRLGFFSKFPVIDLGDVVLRKIEPSDVPDFHEYITSEDVTKYLSDPEIPSSLDAARLELMYWGSLFDKRSSIYWAIAEKESNRLIGTGGFNSWSRDHRRAEISYDLSSLYWNKGIMTKVVLAMTKFGFEVMGVRRIQATIVQFNPASMRVLEKCGYQKEGVLENFGVLHGKQEDFFMYAIIK